MSTARCTPASTRTISRRRHNETHSFQCQRNQAQLEQSSYKARLQLCHRTTKRVCNYVIGRWGDYNDKKYIFTDVLHNGCCSGVVSELIYYYDTVRFYKQYRQEINEMLYNIMNETGLYAPTELFGDKWDKEDPLAQNDFALRSFRTVRRQVGQGRSACAG